MARRKSAGPRRQKPIRGISRARIGAGVIPKIEAKITETAKRFNVSRSFVIAVGMADFFGIKNQERYD